MAILSNGKFYGFLCSARETGNKLANGVKEYVEDFLSGFTGHGWKLWEYIKGKWKLEIDSLVIRDTMVVFELLIQKIRAVKGALNITQASGKIKSAVFDESEQAWLITIEDEMSFVAHDIIRCQDWSRGTLKGYWVEISEIRKIEGIDTIIIPVSEFTGGIGYENDMEAVKANLTGMTNPSSGDEIVQFGNSVNVNRQSAIYLHADEGGQPAIDILFGIKSKNFTGCVKQRIGGNIPGTNGLKGFYCENGMIKGTDSNGHTVYSIHPDGTAEFGDGSARFATDRSGHIAGGAISWQWDATKGKYVCTMEGVLLTWDNLDDETKENLKGDKGDTGEQGPQGIPGTPGENGKVLFTWIRYADNNQGSGISNNPTGKTHIGFAYNKETDIESNNPAEYTWSEIKGEQGVPGKTGTDGKTYYTWIAYSDNADGSNMYQQPTDNTKYIGIAVNKDTAVESNNPSDYTWSKFRGEPGKNGIDGANGVNGADGISMIYKGEYPSHPSNPQNGWYYRNTTDKKSYVCHDNAWYVMTIDGANGKDGLNGKDGNDGISITWKGDLATPPVNPQKNWTYRDMDNGRVYIYNGIAWELMVADGNDGIDGATGQNGSDGKGVYITYHDSESEPDKPTGDGTIGGWHTNSTATVIWISQKVADNASSGVWGDPIRIKGDIGNPGQDANLLPWVEQWEKNKTQIGSEYVVSPKMFSGINSGTADDPVLTGIAIGKECITDKDGNKRTGIFALVDNEPVFELDPITKKYKFEGEVNATSGKFEGEVIATRGKIGGFQIDGVNLSNQDNGDCWISIDHRNNNSRRISSLGNIFSETTGIDTAGYFEASGDRTNYALKLHASGSKIPYIGYGGYSNIALQSTGGCHWNINQNDHWCMPGVLACIEVNTYRNGNDIHYSINKKWGNGLGNISVNLGSAREYVFTHDINHTNYFVMAIPTGQRESDSWEPCMATYDSVNPNSFKIIFWGPEKSKCYPKYFTVIISGNPK
ncbi:hypothetical protein [Bacteroides sp.]|uniref:hypothetical protein n=1 Tax=Bacteroides sp. TaxID=29523 RepID=UPI00260E4F55|nr:hypothetical protein [Bacteroides sp.]MDD3038655.1 hypothetical protein [Bacteroides sp.]